MPSATQDPAFRLIPEAAIDDAEKLRRWALAESHFSPPAFQIVHADGNPKTLVFAGWLLGHGSQGRGYDAIGHLWKRREATIYLTVDGRLLCVHAWVTPEAGAAFTEITEYASDADLLNPMGEDGLEEVDACVRIAARKAARVCPLFGVSGVVWLTAAGES